MKKTLRCKVCKTTEAKKWYNVECCLDCYKKGKYKDEI
jgi:hypothetical protein